MKEHDINHDINKDAAEYGHMTVTELTMVSDSCQK